MNRSLELLPFKQGRSSIQGQLTNRPLGMRLVVRVFWIGKIGLGISIQFFKDPEHLPHDPESCQTQNDAQDVHDEICSHRDQKSLWMFTHE